MRGNGKGKTIIESSQSSVDNVASATFKVDANHFVDFGISIRGYVFIRGKVYGIDEVYLSRAKGPYSRVIFAKTYLSKTVVVPNGWTNWSYDGSTKDLYHAE
ncbi:hypothetical protein N665_0332s0025 [Sinapis alba]|nr:hypothetical protein N665_0332s0025 [Sinapis alba]